MPTTEWTPTTANELSRLVSENYLHHKTPFLPVGGRTSLLSCGPVPAGTAILVTGGLHRIVDYPSRDMTITVEAGIRIEALQAALALQQQRLPMDIPQANRASLGGAIASNTSGPCRYGYGTFRDYVIGMTAVDGQGRIFSAGGRVVKNVAGYDLCKLLIGSQGTLATITEVTLKLRPLYEYQLAMIAAFEPTHDLEPLLRDLNRSATRPVVLDVLNSKAAWQLNGEANQRLPDGRSLVWLEFSGTQAETAWQASMIIEELRRHQPTDILTIPAAAYEQVHGALVEFQTASDDPVTFKASLPKNCCHEFLQLASAADVAVQMHAGNGVAYGHLPDRCTTLKRANEILLPLRGFVERHSGSLTVLKCDPEWTSDIDFYGTRSNAWKVMSQLKERLDPADLMSPLGML